MPNIASSVYDRQIMIKLSPKYYSFFLFQYVLRNVSDSDVKFV